MKLQTLALAVMGLSVLLGCSSKNTIELPLNHYNGYGYLNYSLRGIPPYSNREDNPWKNTYLSVVGVPEGWMDVKCGDIETNIYQSVYQNHLSGHISDELYRKLQMSWDWLPDTLALSKVPLKTKIGFAFGRDSTGVMKVVVDANNNLDFSDDREFIPYVLPEGGAKTKDSVALSRTIAVSFERLVDGKKCMVNAPLFIAYMLKYNMFMCNFSQYSIAHFKGVDIAVCSDHFTSLSYHNPNIVVLPEDLKTGDKIDNEKLIAKNEFLDINGTFYKNKGVSLNDNSLLLEKMDLPKSKLYSTQMGCKAFLFQGNDFKTGTKVSLKQFRGKYVLLDFWAVFCGPCRQEIPNLKKLYEMTDRAKFDIVGIVGDTSPDALEKMIDKEAISWPQLLSTDSTRIKELFGIRGYPTTFLINPEGVIVAKDLRGKELEDKVLALIK